MDGNDEERSALIHEYYQIYRALQKRRSLREHSHFDIYGNNFIEIWEYARKRRGRYICKVKEETETACYKRAIEILISYGGKGDHASMSKKRNKGQDKKQDFLADLNADILDDLTEKGRIRNAAGLAGELTELEEVTDICGLRFNGYLAKIETKRPSGIIDEVAVAFTEAAVDRGKTGDGLRLENYFLPGSRLLISGRQQALKDFKSGKVLVFILAEYIGLSPKAMLQNDVALMGELAYKPTYRETPRGKRISDIFVKVENVLTGVGCYIPCICWQENADEVAGWQPGDKVKLLGRCQSREYMKGTEAGREVKTVYEISVSFIKRIGEAGNEIKNNRK